MNATKNDIANLVQLAEGGEGIIYSYGKDNVIKIYKDNRDLISREKKVKILSSIPLPATVVAPIEPVYINNKFVGYVMRKINGEDFKKLSNRKFIQSNNITLKIILDMLMQIKGALEYLHSNNIFIGDLNDQNIIFDSNYTISIIDCDSWSVGGEKCEVAMDSFKDPTLKLNNFDADTDNFAFAVLCWKTITKLHPYGGTLDPDIDMIERMVKGMHVIDNTSVKIPRTIKSWTYLSPAFISKMKEVFAHRTRQFFNELTDMGDNLTLCKTDNEYYYSKFTTCPICNAGATIITKPNYIGLVNGLRLIPKFEPSLVKMCLNETMYISNDGFVVDTKHNRKTKFNVGVCYYSLTDGFAFVENDEIEVDGIDGVNERRLRTPVVETRDSIYFINRKGSLTQLSTWNKNLRMSKKCSVYGNSYFHVNDIGQYMVVNMYDGYILFMTEGMNYEFKYKGKLSFVDYGIHMDNSTEKWLVVLQDTKNVFHTFILGDGKVMYLDNITYKSNLGCIEFNKGNIFMPLDGKIRGYNYTTNNFKDFDCPVVSLDSNIRRTNDGFIITNPENVYSLIKN